MENEKKKFLIAVTDGSDTSILTAFEYSDVLFKKLKEIVYEFKFKDVIDPNKIAHDITYKRIGTYAIRDKYVEFEEFTDTVIINCMNNIRKMTFWKLSESRKVADAVNDWCNIKFDILDMEKCKPQHTEICSYYINPDFFNKLETNGWIPMNGMRPEMDKTLINEHPYNQQEISPLVYTTEPVLVYIAHSNEYFVDYRRKFLNNNSWCWNRLEGLDDELVFWRVIPQPPEIEMPEEN